MVGGLFVKRHTVPLRRVKFTYVLHKCAVFHVFFYVAGVVLESFYGEYSAYIICLVSRKYRPLGASA